MRTKKSAWAFVAVMLTLSILTGWLFKVAYHEVTSVNPTLPPVAETAETAPGNLDMMLAAALRGNGETSHYVEIDISQDNNELFRAHFDNIAARKGWFVHDSIWRGMKVVLPTGEISELEQIALDPTGWVESNLDARPAGGPSSTLLTHAWVELDTSYGNHFLMMLLSGVIALICMGTFIASMMGTVAFGIDALRRREYSLAKAFE